MVRIGVYDDVDDIIKMSSDFWEYTIYDDPLDPFTIEAMAESCIDNGLMAVLEINGTVCGFACGIKGTLLGNCEVSVGVEVAWWVNPEHRSGRNGLKLLNELEDLALEQGIKYWNMVYMESSMPREIAQLYEIMGYEKVETTYSKELNHGSNHNRRSHRRVSD